MKFSITLPLTALLSLAAAHFPPDDDNTTDVSQCVTRCLSEGAAVAGCVSYVDYQCTCTSSAFKDAVQTCLTDACTQSDITAAGQLHQEVCGTVPQ